MGIKRACEEKVAVGALLATARASFISYAKNIGGEQISLTATRVSHKTNHTNDHKNCTLTITVTAKGSKRKMEAELYISSDKAGKAARETKHTSGW